MRSPEIEVVSVVLLGSFNPTIFQPHWLGTQGLIRKEEAASAKIAIIQDEVADFSTEWFQLQVLQNRFTVQSVDPMQFGPLRDLATGIFTILSHTPVRAIGINKTFHFKMRSADEWHAIGNTLAPKDPWNGVMEGAGLRSMLMEGRRQVTGGGILRVKVEPSAKFEHAVFLEFNEEFRVPPDGSDGAGWALDRISEHWDNIMNYATFSADRILGLGSGR